MTKGDKKPSDEKKQKPRAMHGFFIPAYGFRSCACGELWTGPAYACIDDDGFMWNCPGCASRFSDQANNNGEDSWHG
ncbi:MAG: hypothetical protein AAF936_03825 [Pseudomonadota bacterium]